MSRQTKSRPAGRLATAVALCGLVLISGCATQPQALYRWNGYQGQVYEYFKGSSPEEQIAVLEENVEQAQAKGQALPPGYHAHLGLLYAKLGRDDRVRQEFETEKALFPESSPFMDFLLNKAKK